MEQATGEVIRTRGDTARELLDAPVVGAVILGGVPVRISLRAPNGATDTAFILACREPAATQPAPCGGALIALFR